LSLDFRTYFESITRRHIIIPPVTIWYYFSQDLSYKDKHWHEACFLCSKCRVSLVDKQFGSKVEKIYCGNCYDTQFAARCDGCGDIFRAGNLCFTFTETRIIFQRQIILHVALVPGRTWKNVFRIYYKYRPTPDIFLFQENLKNRDVFLSS